MRRVLNCLSVTLVTLSLIFLVSCSADERAGTASDAQQKNTKQHLAFNGGPTGGTFNFFANKISSIVSARYDWLSLTAKGSGGSAENLRALNDGNADVGIVYAGDAFLGRNCKLPGDTKRYDKVRALAFLYGAPAQLVVRKNSGITSVGDLVGKRVGVGNPGSGAALSAERFFKHLGVWGKMEVHHLGYSQAAREFIDKRIDAFWVLVGYPNSSIIEAASHQAIVLVDLHKDALVSGFYDVYPFYSMIEIPAGTYAGQEAPVSTFQDAALWCASDVMPTDTIFAMLSAVYSPEGLKDMKAAHKAAGDMSVDTGLKGVSIPLHPGAVRFWTDQKVQIPPRLLP